MKGRLVHNRSSYLTIWPVVAGLFFCCLLSFILKSYFLSMVLLILFLVMTAARLWSMQAVKKLDFSVRISATGVFPGETVVFQIEVNNRKFLPVMCAEVYFPLSKDLCLLPQETRAAEEYEKAYLEELGASVEKVGERSLPALLWYETRVVKSEWTAHRRGIYSSSGWKLRTGDGFGLSQMELSLQGGSGMQIAVYPQIVPVDTGIFFRMAWSADTGERGIMEDNTVIRSTRGYLPADPVRHINWRLAAKGLPLSVNIYEEILPQSICFVFDGESFSGSTKHLEEMEKALSIVASVCVALEGKAAAGISFSKDLRGQLATVGAQSSLEELLWAMSAYLPRKDIRNEDNKIIDQQPVFDADALETESVRTGRFYYVTYDARCLTPDAVPAVLDSANTTVLSYVQAESLPAYDVICLADLEVKEEVPPAGAPPAEEVPPAGAQEGGKDAE